MTKTCTHCHEEKDENEFLTYKKSGKKMGACKICYALKRRKNTIKHRGTAQKREKSPQGRFGRLKEGAKAKNVPVLITLEEYEKIISMSCYYCDNKLGSPSIRGSGLDRLDPFTGYQMDNIVSCCYFCNTIKSFLLTPDEMKKVAKLLIRERKGIAFVDAIALKSTLARSRGKMVLAT